MPVLGNHEYQGGEPRLYLAQFALPRNGPHTIPPERAYAFEYSNAKFIILDSNLDAAKQTAWLEKELANTKAMWKFVSYHHPAYSSGGNRDNVEVRNLWTPIFDKYHVDLALQGHDHAYLRTYPMRDQKRVATAKDGTVYHHRGFRHETLRPAAARLHRGRLHQGFDLPGARHPDQRQPPRLSRPRRGRQGAG